MPQLTAAREMEKSRRPSFTHPSTSFRREAGITKSGFDSSSASISRWYRESRKK